jgi:hypothetical protein
MKDKRLLLYSSIDIQERFCHLIRVSRSLGNPYIACCPPSLMVSGGLYAITILIMVKDLTFDTKQVFSNGVYAANSQSDKILTLSSQQLVEKLAFNTIIHHFKCETNH